MFKILLRIKKLTALFSEIVLKFSDIIFALFILSQKKQIVFHSNKRYFQFYSCFQKNKLCICNKFSTMISSNNMHLQRMWRAWD